MLEKGKALLTAEVKLLQEIVAKLLKGLIKLFNTFNLGARVAQPIAIVFAILKLVVDVDDFLDPYNFWYVAMAVVFGPQLFFTLNAIFINVDAKSAQSKVLSDEPSRCLQNNKVSRTLQQGGMIYSTFFAEMTPILLMILLVVALSPEEVQDNLQINYDDLTTPENILWFTIFAVAVLKASIMTGHKVFSKLKGNYVGISDRDVEIAEEEEQKRPSQSQAALASNYGTFGDTREKLTVETEGGLEVDQVPERAHTI